MLRVNNAASYLDTLAAISSTADRNRMRCSSPPSLSTTYYLFVDGRATRRRSGANVEAKTKFNVAAVVLIVCRQHSF